AHDDRRPRVPAGRRHHLVHHRGALLIAARSHRGGGPVLARAQGGDGEGALRRRPPRPRPGPLPPRPHRLLRDPSPRRRLDLPLPRRRPPGGGCNSTGKLILSAAAPGGGARHREGVLMVRKLGVLVALLALALGACGKKTATTTTRAATASTGGTATTGG